MTDHSRSRLAVRWERTRSIPGLARDILAVAVLVSAAAVIGGILLANERVTWPWQHEFTFRAEFVAVPNIAPGRGQEVRIAGVPVGDVLHADVTNRGTAVLTLSVATPDVVYDNARLVLRPKSPLNEMYVTVAPGGPPGQPLRDGALIPAAQTSEPVPVDDVLSHLDDRTRSALTAMLSESDVALAHAPANLPPGLRAADHTVTALRPVVESLHVRTDQIRTLSTALSEIATALGGNDVRLASVANSLQQTLGVVADNDQNLASSLDQLPGLTTDLRRASGNVSTLTGELNPTLDDLRAASGALPATLSRLEDTVGHIDSTVDAAGPFLDAARPVVGDLRPFVADVKDALGDLEPTTRRLDKFTSGLVPYLPDLKAFMAQTASLTSIHDANGGFLRARATVVPQMVPALPSVLRRPQKEPTPR